MKYILFCHCCIYIVLNILAILDMYFFLIQDPEARIYILSMHESHAKDLLCEVSMHYLLCD